MLLELFKTCYLLCLEYLGMLNEMTTLDPDTETEAPKLWPPDAKSWLWPDAGKDWGQEEKGTAKDEMVA